MNSPGFRRTFPALLFLAILCAAGTAAGQLRYKSVDAQELVDRPQNHWARPIVFRDVLEEQPGNRATRFEDKLYHAFETRTVGTCYLDQDLLHIVRELATGQPYMFSGTVYARGSRYYVLVQGVAGAVDAEAISEDLRKLATASAEAVANQSVVPMRDILTIAEGALHAFAAERGLEVSEVLDPQSPHYGAAMEILRSAIREEEKSRATTSSDILARYIYGVLATKVLSAEAAEQEEAVEPAPRPHEAAAEEPQVAEPAEEEPKLSWWQRRRLEKEAREAAEKEARARREAGEMAAQEEELEPAPEAPPPEEFEEPALQAEPVEEAPPQGLAAEEAEVVEESTVPVEEAVVDVPAPEPEPVPVVEEPAAGEEAETPPAEGPAEEPKSWWQRRSEARRQRAAEKAEERRLSEEERERERLAEQLRATDDEPVTVEELDRAEPAQEPGLSRAERRALDRERKEALKKAKRDLAEAERERHRLEREEALQEEAVQGEVPQIEMDAPVPVAGPEAVVEP